MDDWKESRQKALRDVDWIEAHFERIGLATIRVDEGIHVYNCKFEHLAEYYDPPLITFGRDREPYICGTYGDAAWAVCELSECAVRYWLEQRKA